MGYDSTSPPPLTLNLHSANLFFGKVLKVESLMHIKVLCSFTYNNWNLKVEKWLAISGYI
jgi:hypothetical protein